MDEDRCRELHDVLQRAEALLEQARSLLEETRQQQAIDATVVAAIRHTLQEAVALRRRAQPVLDRRRGPE